MKETAILMRIVRKLGENGSVYLDLASGKGNELDSRIYHLKLLYVNPLSDPKAGPGST